MIFDTFLMFIISPVPVLWLQHGYTILGYDSGFRLNGMSHIYALLSNWNPTVNYGSDWSIYRAFSIIQLPEAFIYSATGSLMLAQLIVFIGLFFLIGTSMYFFLNSIFPDYKHRFFRLFSSVLYVFNFLVLHWWLNAERATFSLYIALPLGLLLLYRQAFQKSNVISNVLLFGLLYMLLNGGGSPPLYGGTIVTLALAAIIFSIMVLRDRGFVEFKRLIGTYLLFIISFLLFSAYWLVPLVAYARTSYSSSVAAQGGIGGLIEWEKVFSSHASFVNLFRLQGFVDWYGQDHPFSYPFLHNPILIIVSFFPILVILLGLLHFGIKKIKNRQILLFLLILMVVGAIFTAGSHPPTGSFYLLMMRYIPGFAIFRSSFYKFAPSLWFPIIVLFGYYLSQFIEKYIKQKSLKFFIWVLCILGVLVYHYPFFSTFSFNIPFGFSTRVKIPLHVYEMKKAIEQNTNPDDRILILPDLDPGYITLPMDAYTWGFFSADILPRIMTNRSFLAGDTNDDALTKLLYESFYDKNTDRFYSLASLAGVTHILWRGDVKLSDITKEIRSLEDDENILKTMFGISSVAESGPWKLYKIENGNPSMITTTANPIYSRGVVAGDVLFTGDTSIVRAIPETDGDFVEIIGAECIFCDPNEFKKFEAGIYLPPPERGVKNFLKNIFSSRVQSGNNLKTEAQVLDERLSESLTVLSILFHTKTKENIQNFSDLLSDIEEIYEGLIGREKIIYANRLFAYMVAMERLVSDSNISTDFQNIIPPFREKLKSEIYISDEETYRYLIHISVDGEYTVKTSETISSFLLDGAVNRSAFTNLQNGIHKIEIPRKPGFQAPYVFLKSNRTHDGSVGEINYIRKTPHHYEGQFTRNDQSDEVLIFNQRYNPRWQLFIKMSDDEWELVESHSEANGYANGWIIKNNTADRFKITYQTQKYGIIGAFVSLFSLLLLVVHFIRSVKLPFNKPR